MTSTPMSQTNIFRLFAILVDCCVIVATVWIAFALRLDIWSIEMQQQHPEYAAVIAMLLALPIFMYFDLYRVVLRYAGFETFRRLINASIVYTLLFATVVVVVGIGGVPRTIGFIQPILLFIGIAVTRFGVRYIATLHHAQVVHRTLIYGAGEAGRSVAAALKDEADRHIVGFIDDNTSLLHSAINGIRVFSSAETPQLISKHDVNEVLLAIPSVSYSRRQEITNSLVGHAIRIQTIPTLNDIASGKVAVNSIRELDIHDVLGRDTIVADAALLRKNICNKTVLVTGAGGSIGSELCRQIAQTNPSMLVLLDHCEFALYTIHRELLKTLPAQNMITILASVTDEQHIQRIFSTWKIDTVYHTAAYKHVPLVEMNIAQGLYNNSIGTWVIATAAVQTNVPLLVLISTDKAVRPTNAMGATKRIAEMILQSLHTQHNTTVLAMVRFGNVLNSSGSVIPLFREQIRSGRAVTVTHKNMTRYFMTITEAAQLVIQAGAMANGGEVFVLDMGEPVNIYQLARRLIMLSGLTICEEETPDGDITIKVIGARPGEKIHEELLIGDAAVATSHPRILKAQDPIADWNELVALLEHAKIICRDNDVVAIRALLQRAVGAYVPDAEIVDVLHSHQQQSL